MSASGFYTAYSELVNDPKDTLIAMSRGYTSANLEAAYTFPLARQINKGARYADALYAELLYDVSLYANRDLSASMVRGCIDKTNSRPRGLRPCRGVAFCRRGNQHGIHKVLHFLANAFPPCLMGLLGEMH